ncbi:MAG TPA: hypothetical protein VMF67_01605, partial [Rhizomicrobium sp.]|nr:hypothetical protein [Rhizomicrobium sp.]
ASPAFLAWRNMEPSKGKRRNIAAQVYSREIHARLHKDAASENGSNHGYFHVLRSVPLSRPATAALFRKGVIPVTLAIHSLLCHGPQMRATQVMRL